MIEYVGAQFGRQPRRADLVGEHVSAVCVRSPGREQARALVDLGQADGMPGHIAGPNPVSVMIERSQVLTAILHGQALQF
jgi:hypothetical protein